MILCSGAFDGLHAGHVRYLAAAQRLAHPGEPVVVLVATDGYIADAKRRKPRWPQADRWRTIQAIAGLTAVPSTSASVAADIKAQLPRLFVKGIDWVGKLPDDVREACKTAGTQIVFVDTDGTHGSDAYQDAE